MFVTAHLTSKEIQLALSFIRTKEFSLKSGEALSPHHHELNQKIRKTLYNGQSPVDLTLDQDEAKLLREYNLDYCCVLAGRVIELDLSGSNGARVHEKQFMDLYRMANRVLAAFK